MDGVERYGTTVRILASMEEVIMIQDMCISPISATVECGVIKKILEFLIIFYSLELCFFHEKKS